MGEIHHHARMFKTLDSKPVVRLILPPFTKLSSVDIPMYNFVLSCTFDFFKDFLYCLPSFANSAARIT